MNLSSAIVLLGVIADAWLLALVIVRGRRLWIQATYSACALAFLVTGVSFVVTQEGFIPAIRQDVVVGLMLLSHALTAILVLSLIHGETLPRKRGAAFLLLAPVPALAYLAPGEGWTAATAYDGNLLGGFLVLCLGVALAESTYARLTSRLLAAHSFWLGLGVISLIVAGPMYVYELQLLGQRPLDGANPAAPIALACFALVALQADPFPLSRPLKRGPAPPRGLRAGDLVVFDEVRAKYAMRAAHEEAALDRPTLIVSRNPPPMTASGATLAAVMPSRHASLRTLTTASEFLSATPGGLVVVDALADLSAMSGWRTSLEAVVRMRHASRDTRSTVILGSMHLTESERTALKQVGATWWNLPDPATEIQAILTNSFGSGGSRLLDSFCRGSGLRRDEVTTAHVPALLTFLDRALSELSTVVGGTASHGLRVQFEAGGSLLRSFAAQGPEELARGKWPSSKTSESGTELLVTAAEYWKGKDMDEFVAVADAFVEREPLFEKARSVFVELLGDAGEGVLRTQVARLGKKPEDLDKADLARIADRAAVDLGNLAAVVDLPKERNRIEGQIQSIRHRLEQIVEGTE